MFTDWYDRTKRPVGQVRGKIITAQIAWELDELARIYGELAPRNVLEIGSQNGGTLWHWLTRAHAGTRVMNIDILQNQKPKDADRLPSLWQSWAPDGVLLMTLIGRSDEAWVQKAARDYFQDGVDWLFIDACHTYEGVKYDFEAYGPMVSPGGIIALHDLKTPEHQQHIQVRRLWQEIQEAGYKTQELRAAEGVGWGGIGVIYV